MAKTVLLVCADREQLADREKALVALADKVHVATSFPEAKGVLLETQPDVLVTDLRLNEFNGIHLALWSRVRLPRLRSVIVGQTDPNLADDARAFGFDYVKDGGDEAIIARTIQALDKELPQRQWPRKQLSLAVSAEIAGQPASLLEVGYGGFRVQVTDDGPVPASTFVLELAEFGIQAKATCVWVKSVAGAPRWCGAKLEEAATVAGGAWRTFVDTMQADPIYARTEAVR